MDYVLRAAVATDYRWLWALKRATLRDYVAQTWGRWDDTVQEEFFRQRFDPAVLQIVVYEGRDVGVLHVEQHATEIFLADIAIEPEAQNRGLGTAMIGDVLAAGQALDLPVTLRVLKVNPARRLYERLGFEVASETPTHWVMASGRQYVNPAQARR
jgi:ribosomal protein S18 acetylase RimI-like enzyme